VRMGEPARVVRLPGGRVVVLILASALAIALIVTMLPQNVISATTGRAALSPLLPYSRQVQGCSEIGLGLLKIASLHMVALLYSTASALFVAGLLLQRPPASRRRVPISPQLRLLTLACMVMLCLFPLYFAKIPWRSGDGFASTCLPSTNVYIQYWIVTLGYSVFVLFAWFAAAVRNSTERG
jgi:hypothetical protein